MAAFLLIASPTESYEGQRIDAEVMAKRRLDAGFWGLYANTPHKTEIKLGDRLIVYLAGPGRMCFYATAEAGNVDFQVRNFRADGDVLSEPPAAVLSILSPQTFTTPLPIARIKERLEFVPKKNKKWGCVLQRGVKRISDADASLIVAEATSELIDV